MLLAFTPHEVVRIGEYREQGSKTWLAEIIKHREEASIPKLFHHVPDALKKRREKSDQKWDKYGFSGGLTMAKVESVLNMCSPSMTMAKLLS